MSEVTRPPFSAVVLAGGRSSRFGRDKLAEPIGDETLLDRAVRAVAGIAAEIVVVRAAIDPSPSARASASAARPSGVPYRVVHDPEPFRGPLAGVAAGLAAASQERVLIVGGDMPDLDPAVLRLLIEELADSASAAALANGADIAPLPCALRAAAARALAEALLAAGDRSLRSLLAGLEARAIPETRWRSLDPAGGTLRDVDVPGDLIATASEADAQDRSD